MSKLLDYFSFKSSRFSYSKSKEATARIALYKELKLPNIFTMEASFCGADLGESKDCHFTTNHYMRAGKTLFDSLLIYESIDVQKCLKKYKINNFEESPEKVYESLKLETVLKEMNEISIDMNDGDSSSGSDSEPSEDNLEEHEIENLVPLKGNPKKKKGIVTAIKKRQ